MSENLDLQKVRERLKSALEDAGVSMRAASIAAGFGPGYVHSIIDGTEPTVTRLATVCEVNGISLAYVLFGFDITPETERLLSLMEDDQKARDGILTLLERR